MVLKISRFLLIFLFPTFHVLAQKQLVLINKEDVILRLYPGDEFVFKLKGSDRITTTYVNNLLKSAVVTHGDTVPFYKIDRIYFKQTTFYNRAGTGLVMLGAGLFLIDQLNVTLIQGEDPSLDNRVSRISLASLGAGLPMMLIKKKSQKINYRHQLLTVEKGSPFYRPDPGKLIPVYPEN